MEISGSQCYLLVKGLLRNKDITRNVDWILRENITIRSRDLDRNRKRRLQSSGSGNEILESIFKKTEKHRIISSNVRLKLGVDEIENSI